MIWRTPIIDGNQRYSWTKTRRSLLVSRALPRHVRPSTISCWRRTAFSASSRAVDLNGETKRAKANHRSPITRSAYAIRPPPQWNEVFGTHNNSLGTVAPSKVAFIAHDAMKQLIHEHPRIGDAFWRDTLIDAAIFREWIVNVGGRDAYSRIAHLFCEIFLKLKAVGLTNGTSFDFPITQSKLGEATGLSTVHVNRSVQSLRTDGLIVLERGHCRIPDLERLEQAAMFDRTYLHLRSEQTGSQSLAHLDRPQSHT